MATVETELPPVKYPHIWIDEQGVARLESSRIKVYQIAIDHVHQGLSAAEIHEQYPHLPLAQIYSALSYYYDHQAEIEANIARRQQVSEDLRTQATNQQTRTELLARLQQRGVSLHPDNLYASGTDDHVPDAALKTALPAQRAGSL